MTELSDLRQEHLDALAVAESQQLDALAQQREIALQHAQYWEELSRQAGEAGEAGEPQPSVSVPVPQLSPTLLTGAHFDFLEAVLKAQVAFSRTLLSGGTAA